MLRLYILHTVQQAVGFGRTFHARHTGAEQGGPYLLKL